MAPVGVGPPDVAPGVNPAGVDAPCGKFCEPVLVATVLAGIDEPPAPTGPASPVERGSPFTKRGAVFGDETVPVDGVVTVLAPPTTPFAAMPLVGAAVCGFGLNATSPLPVPAGVLVAPLNGGCVRCAPATAGVPSGAGVGVVFGDALEPAGVAVVPPVAPPVAGTSVSVGGPAGAGVCVACVDDATSFVALDLLEVVDGAVAR